MESLTARVAWNIASQVLKEHSSHPRLLYPAKLSAVVDAGKKNKNYRSILKEMQEAIFQGKENNEMVKRTEKL